MNPRRVHARFRQRCPRVDFAKCEWIHLFSDGCLNEERLRSMLSTLETSHFLIHVQPKIGDYLPLEEALVFIRENIGKSTIYIGDRNFAGLVVVAQNGVATTLATDKSV